MVKHESRRGAWIGLVGVLACGPTGGVVGDGETTGGHASSEDADETFGTDPDGSGSTSTTADDDADEFGEGPICVVGDPGAIGFCDIAHGCSSDEDCGDLVCDFGTGICVPSSMCSANADCSGMPCHDGWCVHTPCTTDDRCGEDAICFAGWCTMIDALAPCEAEVAWSESTLALPDGPPITAIADIELQWGTGLAVARAGEVITTVNVSGTELALEADAIATPLTVVALASQDLVAGLSGYPGADLFVGGTDVAVMAARVDGFEPPTLVGPGNAAALAVSVNGELPYAAALLDDGEQRSAMVFDASFGALEIVSSGVVAADAIDVVVHEDGYAVLVVSPAAIEVFGDDATALEAWSTVSFTADHPAVAGTWTPTGDEEGRAVLLGGAAPLLVVFDGAGPQLVLPLEGAPHALVMAPPFDGADPELVAATDAGLERVVRADGAAACAATHATSIVPLRITGVYAYPAGFEGLGIASDTSVAFLRPP
jgi:hypothetical protein